MNIFKSKLLKKILACLLACVTAFSIACAPPDELLDYTDPNEEIEKPVDENKTQLYVTNFEGGVGRVWLDNVIKEFETDYAKYSFAEGKEGVQIHVNQMANASLFADISNDSSNVYFFQSIDHLALASKGQLLDLTDIVTESLSKITNGEETGSIESKLSEDQKLGMKAINDKYYALPHYEVYEGIVYDIDTFEDYGLYILEGGGYSEAEAFVDGEYVGQGKLSVGPDGVRGTADDGQPSSYEEFYGLMDRMVNRGVVPFAFSGFGSVGYLNLLYQAGWTAWEGYDRMRLHYTFNSGDKQVKTNTVTSFNGNQPVVVEELITPETAYKLSAQEGKYWPLTIIEKIFSKPEYRYTGINGTFTNLDAQEEFIRGWLENKPIAMLIEGNYWYNEAAGALTRAEFAYKDKAKNRRFSMMELPRQATGQVTEGNVTKNTLHSVLNAQAFINANISMNEEVKAAALEFLQYCYTNEQLQKFTVETGVFRGVNYSLTAEQTEKLSIFAKNVQKVKAKSDVLLPDTNSRLYLNNQSTLNFQLGNRFNSLIEGTLYSVPYEPFKLGYTAKDYFINSLDSETSWTTKYGKYFD